MSQQSEVINGNGDTVRVGTTGTISSLISRELESLKRMPQTSLPLKQPQITPVSVPCGSTMKKANQIKSLSTKPSHNSCSNGNALHRNPKDSQNPRDGTRRSGHRIPMLGSEGRMSTERNPNGDKSEKKGHAYIVEVVDIKCSNPLSSRLKKAGFSKLSESTA